MAGRINEVIREMIGYFGNDFRRVNHALKVYSFSKNIGELENIHDSKLRLLEAAAILHDIGIKESERKYNSSSGRYQEIEGPPIAAGILSKLGFDEDVIKRVAYLVGNHHTYNKIDDIDFQILVESDFLVNIADEAMKKREIEIIKEKYFKTETGRHYIDVLFLS